MNKLIEPGRTKTCSLQEGIFLSSFVVIVFNQKPLFARIFIGLTWAETKGFSRVDRKWGFWLISTDFEPFL